MLQLAANELPFWGAKVDSLRPPPKNHVLSRATLNKPSPRNSREACCTKGCFTAWLATRMGLALEPEVEVALVLEQNVFAH